MSEEYIKQLEDTIERMKKEMEKIHAEKDTVEEKWRTHEIYDDSEMWSLDRTLADFIYPRLLKLRELKHGYPSELADEHEWNDIMDKMIKSFHIMVNDERYPNGYDRELQKEIDEGLLLFGKYFQSLWD